jgi:hypothetical protein
LYNHNGQETSDLVHLPFTFQVQFKTPMGAEMPLHKRSKLTDIRAICKGAIPLTLNHMEIWQTQNRLCGRAGEIPAISSMPASKPSTDTGKRFKGCSHKPFSNPVWIFHLFFLCIDIHNLFKYAPRRIVGVCLFFEEVVIRIKESR